MEWALANPRLTALLVVVLAYMLVQGGGTVLLRSLRMATRYLNIRRHGWPPPHLDADGDAVRRGLRDIVRVDASDD